MGNAICSLQAGEVQSLFQCLFMEDRKSWIGVSIVIEVSGK